MSHLNPKEIELFMNFILKIKNIITTVGIVKNREIGDSSVVKSIIEERKK